MRHLYCTIAIGEEYVNSVIEFAKRLNDRSKDHHILIATDKEYEVIDNVTYTLLPEDAVLFTTNSGIFNYNLKYYPLFIANQMDYDHVIFFDSDWRILDGYDEQKIVNLLTFMDEQGYDMFFERPHTIGAGKHDGHNCFWRHKRDFYNLLDTDEYDTGHVCNEQFMVFKNNEKFDVFVKKWEELCNIASKNNLWGYAEGVEIGMSTVTAKMNCAHNRYWEHLVRSMFEFTSRSGGEYIRF